jgi:hypothetical protein
LVSARFGAGFSPAGGAGAAEQEQAEGSSRLEPVSGLAGSPVSSGRQQAQPGGIVALQQLDAVVGLAGQAAAFPVIAKQEPRTAMQAIQPVNLVRTREKRTGRDS